VTADTFVPPGTGSDEGEECPVNDDSECSSLPGNEIISSMGSKFGENLLRIYLPNEQVISVISC